MVGVFSERIRFECALSCSAARALTCHLIGETSGPAFI